MKGFFLDLGWTIIVVMFALVIIFVMAIMFILFQFSGSDPLSYTIRFVELTNKPYLLAGPIAHLQVDDRQFLEHAIESSVVGSLQGSNSNEAETQVRSFLSYFDLGYYNVQITGADTVLNLDNMPPECGVNEDGYCVSDKSSHLEDCGIGRIEISQSGQCHSADICCKWDPDAYEQSPPSSDPDYELYRCGNYDMGVCNDYCDPDTMIKLREGREYCKNLDVPKKYCCTLKTSVTMTETTAATAIVPLFYRNRLGEMLMIISYR